MATLQPSLFADKWKSTIAQMEAMKHENPRGVILRITFRQLFIDIRSTTSKRKKDWNLRDWIWQKKNVRKQDSPYQKAKIKIYIFSKYAQQLAYQEFRL
jgi:hypothetical protein